ncbi:MAG: imidazolonepropionase [Nitrospiraceae bacterium]
MAQGRDLFVANCGQLLTLRGPARARSGQDLSEIGLVRNGAVLIRNQTIEMVGPQARVARSSAARRAVCLDAQGKVVLPGFVDSHTHALFAGSRLEEYAARIRGASYEEIANAGGGIQASAKQMRSTSEAALGDHLKQIIQRFLEHGTTTAEIKSGYGLELDQERKMLRVIKTVAARADCDLISTLLFHDVPARLKSARPRFIKLATQQLIPEAARRQLAAFCDVFCDRGYFSVAEANEILSAASRAGLKLKLHAEQLVHTGAARLAASLEAVSVDHVDHVKRSDMPRLRKAGTIATLLPGSVFHLGTKTYPPARDLIDEGIPVALATNFNPGSSPTLNMQMILSLACSYMRMSPAEAISAATINGAYALGLGSRLGSLEPGKQADLTIMDASDYREIPYYFGMNHCRTVIKKGKVLFSKSGR